MVVVIFVLHRPGFPTLTILINQKRENLCLSKNCKFEKFKLRFFKKLGTLFIFVFSYIMAYFFDGIIDYYCTSFVLLSLREENKCYVHLFIQQYCSHCNHMSDRLHVNSIQHAMRNIFTENLDEKKTSNPIQNDDKIKGARGEFS